MAKTIYIIVFISFALSAASAVCYAQQIEYRTLPGSKMWIEGTSTLNDYTCLTKDVYGFAEVYRKDSLDQDYSERDKAFLRITVRSLDCGRVLMNDDLYGAMKSGRFPFIIYDLLKAHFLAGSDSADGWYTLETEGNLSIAGDTNKVDITMKVKKLSDGVYRLVGSKALTMNDFKIIPPSHFFGLIRAHEGLTVYFDLLAARIGSTDFTTQRKGQK